MRCCAAWRTAESRTGLPTCWQERGLLTAVSLGVCRACRIIFPVCPPLRYMLGKAWIVIEVFILLPEYRP